MAKSNLAILNPVVLNGILQKWTAPETYLGQAMFPREDHPFPTVKYDVIRGSRQVAKYNVPNSEAHIVAPLKVGQVAFNFLYTREKKVMNPTTLHWLRTPGQLADKNAEKAVTREMMDLNGRNERLVEFSIWQALSGTLSIDTESVQVDIDFEMAADHKPVAGTKWDKSEADIIGDVNAWKRLIRENALAVADKVYLNSKTFELLMGNERIVSLLGADKKDKYVGDGTIPNLMGMEWTVNDEMYHDESGNVKYYIPDGKLIMLATKNQDGSAPFALLDGPSADDSAPAGTVGKFAKTWKEEDPSARQILVERTWFPAIKHPDNIVYATVL